MAAAKKPLEFHAKRPWRGEEAVEDPDEDNEEDNDEAENGFSLEEVLRLGGTKQDYLMLATLDENEEVVDGGKKGAIDDLQQGELEAFIQNLSLAKYAKAFLVEEDEPAKKENASKKEAKVSKVDNKKQNAAESERTSLGKVKNKKKPEQHSYENNSVTPKVKKDKQQDIFEFFERQTLLLKPGGKWYDLEYSNEYSLEPQPQDVVSKYKILAQKLYEHEINLFKNKTNNQKGASSTWMKTIVSSGTLGDRMAAMILLIQDDAVHTLQFVETLVNLFEMQPLHLSYKEEHTKPWGSKNVPVHFFKLVVELLVNFSISPNFSLPSKMKGNFLLIVCLKSWLVFILLNKKYAPKTPKSSTTKTPLKIFFATGSMVRTILRR